MTDCIFCKIAAHDIPSNVVLDDDDVFAFHDLNPQAPVHILVIPKRHIVNAAEAVESDGPILGRLMRAASTVAEIAGIDEGGYRIVANVGADGGQTVNHLHLHVLGGRRMTWPPG
jgi:histidine triad (HIT) family protein